VPIGRSRLATAAARDVATTWAAAQADDKARLEGLGLVLAHLGPLDTALLATALQRLDVEASHLLEVHRRHLLGMHTWTGDVSRAAHAVAAALGAQVAGLQKESRASLAVAGTGTITDPTGDAAFPQNALAQRTVDGMLRAHHLKTPKVRAFRLHSADGVLAVLTRPTDTAIHVHLVVYGQNGVDLYDLDSGRRIRHLVDAPSVNEPFTSARVAGPNLVASFDAGSDILAANGTLVRFLKAATVYAARDGIWSVRPFLPTSEVQRLADNGEPQGGPIEVPRGWYPVAVETDGTMLLATQTYDNAALWSPGRTQVQRLAGAPCLSNATADGAVAAFISGQGCVPDTVIVLSHSQRHDVRAPGRLTFFGTPAIDPTGRHIAVTLTNSQDADVLTDHVAIVDVATGKLSVLPTQVQATAEGWSPDGEWLLVRLADPEATGRLALWQIGGDGRLHSVRLPIDGDGLLAPASFG
jgi:hypothetical protein